MECMLSMPVFSHLRRLWIGEYCLKGNLTDGFFIFCITFYINFFNAFALLVLHQTQRLTGCKDLDDLIGFHFREDSCIAQ